MKLFTLLLSAVGLSAQPITSDFINRVAIVESNYNYEAVGDKGKARGAWQMHQAAWTDALKWYEFTNAQDPNGFVVCIESRPWSDCATDPYISRVVATYYFKLLEHKFKLRGINPTHLQLYMAYNMGFARASQFKFNPYTSELPAKSYAILRRAELIICK
ncbi:Transglycosylase SLT domain 1 [uncultured Caudovirales phage]|uniref:Transglycosylase SLT domain 1 n=1 Tax=uncultured Caudovirales phage TaxID=2100421 RepID=A0A6J7XKG3_9CAUD|nr:Transglycosylase SLT domain 1 [uncultured Caudovirales phage]